MSYIRTYFDGDYEINQYTGGGDVRDRLTGEIVAWYDNAWTPDESPHPTAVTQVEFINKKFGLNIKLN